MCVGGTGRGNPVTQLTSQPQCYLHTNLTVFIYILFLCFSLFLFLFFSDQSALTLLTPAQFQWSAGADCEETYCSTSSPGTSGQNPPG